MSKSCYVRSLCRTCARHGTWVGEGWEDVGSLLAAGVHPGAVPQPNGPRSVAAVRAPPSVGPLEAGGASNGASFAEETDRVGQGGPGSRGADGVDGIEAELREIEMLTDARLGSDMGERELQGIAQDLQRVIGAANGGRGAAGVALDGLSARAEAVARSMAEELLGVGFGVGQHGDVLRDLDGQEEPFKAHV